MPLSASCSLQIAPFDRKALRYPSFLQDNPMENYHRRLKVAKPKFESYDDAGSGSAGASRSKISTQEHNRPQQHGVMVISPNGKIRNYVSRALEVLTEADNDDDTAQQEGADSEQEKTSKTTPQGTAKSSSVCVCGRDTRSLEGSESIQG